MSAVTVPVAPAVDAERISPAWAVSDALAVAHRNIISLYRVPTTLVFSTIQPVIFVLMFRYVFGGAIHVPGVSYVNFLMPGIFVQTVAFGSVNTGIGLAEDLQKGLIERFRSLPMARSAVLAGRALADVARNLLVIVIMVVVGFMVGFRVQTNAADFLAAIILMLALGVAMSWIMALIGLSTGNGEAAQAASFPLMALLVFASNCFVPTATMPGWLRAYANHQPVSATVTAIRRLVLGGSAGSAVLVALLWITGIVVIFAPLSVRRYRRSA
jgi:ABC-2 type transport system permease protein/oleandomycin transport system permease protein